MELVRRVPPRVRGLVAVALAAVFAVQQLYEVIGGWIALGIDFLPLRHAAQALLHGQSVYSDPFFVYPPTAAVFLLPTALGRDDVAFGCWVVVSELAILLAIALIRQATEPRYRLYVFAIALLGLLGGVIAARSIFLGNLSEILVPVAVGVLLSFHRGRWVLGCALLAASLLVKPLLVPLLLIPALRRQWRALAVTMVPAGALLLLSMVLVPGGRNFPEVLRYCLAGTNLHGSNAVNNLSLRGWAEGQHAPAGIGVAAAALVLIVVAARVLRSIRAGQTPAPVWLGNVVLLTVLLAGGISEVHYLLTTLATTLLYLVTERAPARVWASFVPGLALLAAPSAYPGLLLGAGTDGQTWLVAGEVFLLAALLLAPPQPDQVTRPALTPGLEPARQ